jgi:hypothetical protein
MVKKDIVFPGEFGSLGIPGRFSRVPSLPSEIGSGLIHILFPALLNRRLKGRFPFLAGY